MPSQTPGKESSGCDAESVVPDSASLGDDLHYNSSNLAWQNQLSLDQFKNSQTANPFGSIETPSPITTELPPLPLSVDGTPQHHHTPNPNTHGHNVQILSSPVMTSSTTAMPTPSANSSANRRYRNSVTDASLKEFGSSKF